MSGHLPECFDPQPGGARLCICDRLRACEQRLANEWAQMCEIREVHVREEALDRARDAVAALLHGRGTCTCTRCVITRDYALAAIDAIARGGTDD